MDKIANDFSVILPVRNGGKYLPLCVKSILAQTYQGFELVILENQSTDGTSKWLQALEREDSRVKVMPSKTPLSMEENWKRILSVPKKKFMTVIGHDDLLEPNFLEEINTLVRDKPEVNLYQTHFRLIDSEGKLIRYCMPIPKYETAAEFLAARMAEIRDSFGTGYVMLSEQYDKVGGIPSFGSLLYADDALWLSLMGSSYKVTSPRACFSYRLHSKSVSGKPNSEALFNGLKQYLGLLTKLVNEDKELARVVKRYVPQYVSMRCQYRYHHLLKMTFLGVRVDKKTVSELEVILKEFAPETALDKSYMSFSKHLCRKLLDWLARKCD